MLKVNENKIEVKGTKSTLLAEYALLTHGMKEAFAEKDGLAMADYLLISAQQDGLRVPIENKKEEEEDDTDDLLSKVDKIIEDLERGLKHGRNKD